MNPLLATLSYLALHFAALSLMAFGGVNTVVPEIQRQSVVVAGWVTDREFADLFAIAQAAPGPNTLIVALIGWRAAGLPGAVVAFVAICAPAAALTFLVLRVWRRFKDSPWRAAVQDGLTPVTIGMVAASAYLLTRATAQDAAHLAITLAVATLAYVTRWNPLWLMAGAGMIGYLAG